MVYDSKVIITISNSFSLHIFLYIYEHTWPTWRPTFCNDSGHHHPLYQSQVIRIVVHRFARASHNFQVHIILQCMCGRKSSVKSKTVVVAFYEPSIAYVSSQFLYFDALEWTSRLRNHSRQFVLFSQLLADSCLRTWSEIITILHLDGHRASQPGEHDCGFPNRCFGVT